MPTPGSTLIPALRYRYAAVAVDFLCRAFGFTRRAVFTRQDGAVEHAELLLENSIGNGMVMLGTADPNSQYGKVMSLVGENGVRPTATMYLVVPDAAVLYESAQAAGADIISPLETMSYGGRAFGCFDTEGNSWSVGEYNPWAEN